VQKKREWGDIRVSPKTQNPNVVIMSSKPRVKTCIVVTMSPERQNNYMINHHVQQVQSKKREWGDIRVSPKTQNPNVVIMSSKPRVKHTYNGGDVTRTPKQMHDKSSCPTSPVQKKLI